MIKRKEKNTKLNKKVIKNALKMKQNYKKKKWERIKQFIEQNNKKKENLIKMN